MLHRTGVLLVALAFVASGCSGGDDSQKLNAVAPEKTTTTTTTIAALDTTTSAPVAKVAGTRIQRVRALPGDRPARAPKAAAPSRRGPTPTGRIEIPRIGLNHLTYEGIELSTIDHGPSHWPGTALPGQVGNTVFPGHRVTHSRPFFNIDLIQIGDHVTFVNSSGRYTYEVTQTFIVDDSEMWIADPTDTPTMTIFACHPKRSAQQRYVVKGNLIKSDKTSNSAEPAAASPNSNGGDYNTAPDPAAPPETTTTTSRGGLGGIFGGR